MLGHDSDKRQDYPLGNPAHNQGYAEYYGRVEECDYVLVVFEAEEAEQPVYNLHDLFGDGVGRAIAVADEMTYVVDRRPDDREWYI